MTTSALTCEELMERFEALEFLAAEFHHTQHLQLAFAYLRDDEPLEAIRRFRTALKRFALHHGAKNLYHETITMAFLLLVHDRMQRSETRDWSVFSAANADLFAWKPSILERFYRAETLSSALAKRTFLWPDAL